MTVFPSSHAMVRVTHSVAQIFLIQGLLKLIFKRECGLGQPRFQIHPGYSHSMECWLWRALAYIMSCAVDEVEGSEQFESQKILSVHPYCSTTLSLVKSTRKLLLRALLEQRVSFCLLHKLLLETRTMPRRSQRICVLTSSDVDVLSSDVS